MADLTPVWRKFDGVRIRSSADPDQAQEATVTREMLIGTDPASDETCARVMI